MSLIHEQKSRKQEKIVHVMGWGHIPGRGNRIRKAPREETACCSDGSCGNKNQPEENKQRPFTQGTQPSSRTFWQILKGYQLLVNPGPFSLIVEGLLFGFLDRLLEIVVCLLQVWLTGSRLASEAGYCT